MEHLDVLVVSEAGLERHERDILGSVIMHLQSAVGWRELAERPLSAGEQRKLSEESADYISQEVFFQEYDSIKDRLDIPLLRSYAQKTNPQLHKDLLMAADPVHILWHAYQQSLKDGAWETDKVYLQLRDLAKQNGYCNVVGVFFRHTQVAAQFVNHHEQITYHMMGRGFVAEGCRWPILVEKKQGQWSALEGRTMVSIPLALARPFTPSEQVAYAQLLMNHELIGHALLGLRDHTHTDVSPLSCIMSVADSREETVRIAKSLSGRLQFCPACNDVYKKSVLYKS